MCQMLGKKDASINFSSDDGMARQHMDSTGGNNTDSCDVPIWTDASVAALCEKHLFPGLLVSGLYL